MSFFSLLARNVFAPAMDLIRGTHTMSCLRELEESQWWPAERLEELQSSRLRALITHAYEHVPYYRRVMDERGLAPSDIRSAADLPKLPILTRELVRANFENLLAQSFPRTQLRRATTGGSTGNPLVFYATSQDQRDHGFARGIRALEFAGVELGDRRVLIRIARRHDRAREKLLHHVSRRVERVVEFDSRDITLRSLPSIVALLRRSDIRRLTGYPSAVAYIAAWIRETGVTPPELDSVVTGGEQLFEHQRQRIRDVFNREPHSKYACQEVFEIAMECEAHTGLHVAAEDVVLEIVDDADTSLPPGKEGRILLTNLHNYGMPFIRYENGDAGSFVAEACPCGRALPLLSHVVGRRFDVIHTPSGRRITDSNLGAGRFALLPILQFQVVQEGLDHIVVRIVPRTGTGPAGLEDIRARIPPMLNEIVGDDVRVAVEFCDHIALTAGGKHLLVVSNIDPDICPRQTMP